MLCYVSFIRLLRWQPSPDGLLPGCPAHGLPSTVERWAYLRHYVRQSLAASNGRLRLVTHVASLPYCPSTHTVVHDHMRFNHIQVVYSISLHRCSTAPRTGHATCSTSNLGHHDAVAVTSSCRRLVNSTEDFHTTSHLHYALSDSSQVTVTGAEGLPGRYSTRPVL